jgi:hypothetical protein
MGIKVTVMGLKRDGSKGWDKAGQGQGMMLIGLAWMFALDLMMWSLCHRSTDARGIIALYIHVYVTRLR